MLSDTNCKTFLRTIRYILIPACKNYVSTTQYGSGLNKGDTGVAHLLIRCIADFASMKNMATCTLYLDIVAAFATLLRRIVSDVQEGDEV